MDLTLKLVPLAPYINLLACLNPNDRSSAAKDFATGNIFSEGMAEYLTSNEDFFRKVLEPLQALSQGDLMEQLFPKIAARDSATAEEVSVEPLGDEAKEPDPA